MNSTTRPPRRRRAIRALIAAMVAVPAATWGGHAPASAHALNSPFDFDFPAGYCAFPVHSHLEKNRQYASVTTLPNGSVVVHITGSVFVMFTNDITGRSVTVNASGPGTGTFTPDFATVISHSLGRLILIAPNLTAFGFPSNIVLNAGPLDYTQVVDPTVAGAGPVSNVSGHARVLVDVCGALAG